MDERRRRQRTDLDAQLVIKRTDGSKIGDIYEGTLTIWTKEKLKVFLDIVRRHEIDGGFNYGAHFVGMPDLYKRKIGVYQTVEDETKKQSEKIDE